MQRRQFLATAAASALAAGCHDAPRALEGSFTGIDIARGHALRDL
ncbi:amine oxidase, partial [Acidovorax delafieldii 2AN]